MNCQILILCVVCTALVTFADSFKLLRSKRSTNIPSKCFEPPETGMCMASFQNYYYNPSSGECETFVYGGCNGNENNFWAKSDCEAICKPDENDDEDNSSLLESLEALIENKDDCEYPPETGDCRAIFPMYYFDGEKCSLFTYGGCGGNPNKFDTEEECIERCVPNSTNGDSFRVHRLKRGVENACEQAPNSGMCLALFINYYYNKTANTCNKFVYGGCGGNDNNFPTGEDCVRNCGGTIVESDDNDAPTFPPEEVCDLPPEVGPCKARITRYYFDGKKCDTFTYGGCDGNKNNFETLEQCLDECGHRIPDDDSDITIPEEE